MMIIVKKENLWKTI
jgi:hypothetical protein